MGATHSRRDNLHIKTETAAGVRTSMYGNHAFRLILATAGATLPS
jgi:hypothetical protein